MLKNIGSNWAFSVASAIVAFILTPFTFRMLGQESFGTLTLIVSLTGYLGLLLIGVPMTSLKFFAEHIAEKDLGKLNGAISSCAALYLAMGISAVLIGGGLFIFFVCIYDIPVTLRAEANIAFCMIVCSIGSGFFVQIPGAIMAAHHDFVVRNLVLLGSLVLRFGLTIYLLSIRPSLVFVPTILLICQLCEYITYWFLVKRRYPGVRISLRDFDWGTLRKILSFSLFVFILSLGTRLTFETGPLIIGKFMDVGKIAFYSVANNFLVYILDFVLGIAVVILPTAAKLHSTKDFTELRNIFLKWSKIALSLVLLPGIYLIVLGPRFVGWWIDPSFEGPGGEVLVILVASSLVFFPVRGVAFPILIGLGKPKKPTVGFLIAGAVNLGLSVILVRPFGLMGVALGTAIPNVLFALVLIVLTCRELGISLLSYSLYVLPKVAVGVLPAVAVLFLFKYVADVHSLYGLVIAGLTMTGIFGIFWGLFVYREDRYFNVPLFVNNQVMKLMKLKTINRTTIN